jgi:hypothetical protein
MGLHLTLLLVIAGLVGVAAAPAPAAAGTVEARNVTFEASYKVPGARLEISFVAAPGEANRLTLTAEKGELVFREATLPIGAKGLCRSVTPQETRAGSPVVVLRIYAQVSRDTRARVT